MRWDYITWFRHTATNSQVLEMCCFKEPHVTDKLDMWQLGSQKKWPLWKVHEDSMQSDKGTMRRFDLWQKCQVESLDPDAVGKTQCRSFAISVHFARHTLYGKPNDRVALSICQHHILNFLNWSNLGENSEFYIHIFIRTKQCACFRSVTWQQISTFWK